MHLPTSVDPKQQQQLPGSDQKLQPAALHDNPDYLGSGKLKGKVALITGGDSGIGRAVAIAFAKEGAKLVISYLCEDEDANHTLNQVSQLGAEALLSRGDISDPNHCQSLVKQAISQFGQLDILVNHAGEQYQTNSLDDITPHSLQHIFAVNVFSMFYLSQAALKHMTRGAVIINTVSVVAYKGSPQLLDYSATKGAGVAFTRALAAHLAPQGIRVNAVAPGPIWTPLIPASFSPEKLASFGQDTPLGRMGQPFELASAYVFLASNIDSSFVTGQVIHVNGGIPVAG
jgi:NAD(P)-dependent dehydrogenase (short-subunit alcohol dehydrogenase family)